MSWTRNTGLLFAGLFVMACGSTVAPTARAGEKPVGTLCSTTRV